MFLADFYNIFRRDHSALLINFGLDDKSQVKLDGKNQGARHRP